MRKIVFFIAAISLSLAGCAKKNNDDVFEVRNIKSQLEKVTRWQFKNPKHASCDWTNGAFYTGVFAAWEATKADFIYQGMMDMGNQAEWRPCDTGPMDRANDVAISQTFIDLYRIEKKDEMIRPTIDTLNQFIERIYKPKGHKVQKWWWCDALFMEPAALVKLGITLNDNKYLEYNDKNFKECYELLYDKEEHLFARDIMYVIKGDGKDLYEANGKKIFWGRGNGWVLGGLARILSELPSNYPERSFYENLFKEISERIASIQQEDGLWRTSLLDPESYPGGEVSGSGFICYGLTWGVNNGLLDKATYLSVIEKAWIALNQCINEEGRVGWVQPIGDNPLKNFSEDSWEVYGTGAFLLAGSEMIKLKR